ncbi:MAG: PLP-dependent aminotransferase family protein, partial [Acidobacteriota bacterium]|nr:PLP-dependent aminotransferase family protein [Acidobacteriota bacterium]
MTVATLNMIRIDRRRREPLQLQLYEQVRRAIISRELAAGVRLPSTRDLVEQLGLSRNTIVNAFERLASEGYLDSRVGSGIYVAHLPAAGNLLITRALSSGTVSNERPRITRPIAALTKVSVNPDYPSSKVRPFRPCQPAVDQFPLRSWNRARSYALRFQSKELMQEGDVAGLPRLRAALATYLSDARGVKCEPDQIIITAGAQEALSLIAESLADRGDSVCIEDPGYLGARAAFIRAGLKLIPTPVDAEGLRIPSRRQTPRLIYTTPSRQFPLGVTMTLSRRLALLEFARAGGAWIIEDDYDSEFRYTGRPAPSLQGLDQDSRVIYVGSFSKVLFGSLRLGYIVAPHALVKAICKLKEVEYGSSPVIEQATAAVFIEEGYFSTHVRRMRRLYRERRDGFLQTADKHLSGLLAFPPIEAGMDAVG